MSVPRRAKLVCTLGPASDSLQGLRALIDAGMDVARLNFSHGTHEDHGAALARLREASDLEKKSVAALDTRTAIGKTEKRALNAIDCA